MKLSTRSRYGTRLMLDMAQHYNEGPIHLGDIAKRQDVSVKYLEQIIIPLKKAHYIESVRGAKGGHILTKPPKRSPWGRSWRSWRKAPAWWSVLRPPRSVSAPTSVPPASSGKRPPRPC